MLPESTWAEVIVMVWLVVLCTLIVLSGVLSLALASQGHLLYQLHSVSKHEALQVD